MMRVGRRIQITGGLAAVSVLGGVVAILAVTVPATTDHGESEIPARSITLTALSAAPDVTDSVIESEAQDGSHFIVDTPAEKLSDSQLAARAQAIETALAACGANGEHPLVAASLVRATIDGHGLQADPNDPDGPIVRTVDDRLIWIVELANAQEPVGGPGSSFTNDAHVQQVQVSDLIVMIYPDQKWPFRVETVSVGARMEPIT